MLNNEEISGLLNVLKGERTNKEICKAGKLNEAQFGKWLKGEASIKLQDFSIICDVVGIPLHEALKFENMEKKIPVNIQSHLNYIRKNLIELWLEIEGGNKDSKLIKIIMAHISNLKDTLKEVNKTGSLPIKMPDNTYNNVAEESEEYEVFEFPAEKSLPELKLIKDENSKIKKYSRACAGNAGNIEDAPELLPYYIKGSKKKDVDLIEVFGDSMHPTIQDGDVIAVETFKPALFIGGEKHVPLAKFREKVPHGSICLINLENHGQEIKEILYEGTNNHWGLKIKAHNAQWNDRILKKGQTLSLYGLVIGKVKL